jgi:4-hydroxy-2-oxoheptanedioate aldolase
VSTLPRLNGLIGALEAGQHCFSLFAPCEVESAVALSTSKYDGVVFEGEHNGWDIRALRDSLQFLLTRAQIAKADSVAPALTPMARIPANGVEKNQFLAKQALDLGCYGIVWPHISTVEEAYNAVAACRYPRRKDKPLYEPAGIRGDGPTQAVRYWGVTQAEYYARADVWPLAPQGEILVVIQIEDLAGIANLDDMLKNVPGIGAVLIGEGDLSQELGYPRQYEHKEVLDAMAKIVATCKRHKVVVGHPHVEAANAERVIGEGYRFLMCSAPRSFATLDKARGLAGRK